MAGNGRWQQLTVCRTTHHPYPWIKAAVHYKLSGYCLAVPVGLSYCGVACHHPARGYHGAVMPHRMYCRKVCTTTDAYRHSSCTAKYAVPPHVAPAADYDA